MTVVDMARAPSFESLGEVGRPVGSKREDPKMSDRTKFFVEKEAQARRETDQRQREAAEAKQREEEQQASFVRAAEVYRPLFEQLAEELRSGGLSPKVMKEPSVVTAVDPHTQERYAGNSFLRLTFSAGRIAYELAYVVATQPNVLGMLAWRKNHAETYYVGPQSKASTVQLETRIAEHHVNVAWEAMKADR